MRKLIKISFFVLLLINITTSSSIAINGSNGYRYTLENFNSIEEFENDYTKYIQDCLDNSGGGLGGINCLVESQVWDKELNIQYNKLCSMLGDSEKKLIKEAQQKWLLMRDADINTQEAIVDNKFNNDGTMYVLIKSRAIDRLTAEITKQRVIYFMHIIKLLQE